METVQSVASKSAVHDEAEVCAFRSGGLVAVMKCRKSREIMDYPWWYSFIH